MPEVDILPPPASSNIINDNEGFAEDRAVEEDIRESEDVNDALIIPFLHGTTQEVEESKNNEVKQDNHNVVVVNEEIVEEIMDRNEDLHANLSEHNGPSDFAVGIPILRLQPVIINHANRRGYSGRTTLNEFVENTVKRSTLPGMTEVCPFCRAKLFPWEMKNLSCCFKGKITLPEIRWPDSESVRSFRKLFTNSRFMKNIRKYNALFAFTSIGTKEVKHQGRGPISYCVQGQLTHNIESILPQGESTEQLAQIYIVDIAQQLDIRSRMFGANTSEPAIIS